jgi:phosphopantetheinyl transferase
MILGCMELNGLTGHEAGRILLQNLWQEHLRTRMPQIRVTDRGKPYFADGNWHFSISHTKRRVFCVLADQPVGIDAEEMDRDINLRLADKILSSKEKAQFDAAEDKRTALLKFWVLKEAAAKLSGEGLKGYPNHTNFSLEDPRVFETNGCIVAILTE